MYREGDLNLILDKGRKEGNTSISRVNTFRGIYTLYSFVSLQKLTQPVLIIILLRNSLFF